MQGTFKILDEESDFSDYFVVVTNDAFYVYNNKKP